MKNSNYTTHLEYELLRILHQLEEIAPDFEAKDHAISHLVSSIVQFPIQRDVSETLKARNEALRAVSIKRANLQQYQGELEEELFENYEQMLKWRERH